MPSCFKSFEAYCLSCLATEITVALNTDPTLRSLRLSKYLQLCTDIITIILYSLKGHVSTTNESLQERKKSMNEIAGSI